VVVGLDFSRHYEFFYSNVIPQQSYSTSKASILVVYVGRRDAGEVYYETFFFITDPAVNRQQKNPGLVHHCLEIVFDRVGVGHGVQYVHLFSDGEFKTKPHFTWLGQTAKKRKTGLTWNYYAPNHGKGLYDGEGGVLKNCARQYVLNKGTKDEQPISTLEELVAFGQEHLAKPPAKSGPCVRQRYFFHVKEKLKVPKEARQFTGSKSFFAYRADKKGKVHARLFSCYCDACVTREGDCPRPSSEWTDAKTGYL